jgi:hypothetical protein
MRRDRHHRLLTVAWSLDRLVRLRCSRYADPPTGNRDQFIKRHVAHVAVNVLNGQVNPWPALCPTRDRAAPMPQPPGRMPEPLRLP